MTAKAKTRSGDSPRSRKARRHVCESVGSSQRRARISGKPAACPGCASSLLAGATVLATKAPVYHASTGEGINLMDPENPELVSDPAPPEGALTVAPPLEGSEALLLNDPAALAAQLATYAEARRLLVEWLMSQLVAGIDYTLIHRRVGPRGNKTDCPNKGNMTGRGCEVCGGKSTLCKPGSEKLCGLLRLRPRFVRDVETWEMLGSEAGVLALKCELVTASGVVVAEGRGARHRDQDFGDVNKSIKMVQKSAQTDAVLRGAGLSEIFTQDLEDLPRTLIEGDDNGGGEFAAPKRKSDPAAPATPAPPSLQQQLEESVRRTAPKAPPPPSRPAPPRPAPTRPAPRPAPRAPTPVPAGGATPPDALSPARVNRLMALLHEAVEAAEVPQDQHAGVFDGARAYLVDWVGQTQGRERLSDCSWKAYDELCAQVPAAVEAAISGQAPAPRHPRPRLVRRYGSTPRSFNTPRREF